MTRGYEPRTGLDTSAQELLESFNSVFLREARRVAARRSSDNNRVSFPDILNSPGRQQERVRWRERAAFSAQVILTAVAISAAVMSIAVTYLVISSDDTGGSGTVSSARSLFTTVLLATLLIVSAAILFAIFREPKKEGRSEKSQSRIEKVLLARSSRRESELALLSEWSDFEELIKRELYADPSDAPGHNLSRDIVRFSRRYDLDPEEIRSILRARMQLRMIRTLPP